ncbi:MAG TPA: BsuPI-related putative proteinase inhibitor [Actinomycetota bacterium]|nr:BsuPI-related putative proteinase inhibitor [Actinomycetota bacterium]
MALELEVRNDGDDGVVYWTGGQQYELWVSGPNGTLWVWSEQEADKGRFFELALSERRLAPGDRRRVVDTWRQRTCSGSDPLRPGRYVARAAWLALDDPDETGTRAWFSNPVTIRIGSRRP